MVTVWGNVRRRILICPQMTATFLLEQSPIDTGINNIVNILFFWPSWSDNNGVTSLHNSYPRVIAALKGLLELVYL